MNKLIVFFLILFFLSCQRKSMDHIIYERYKDSVRIELMKNIIDTAEFNKNIVLCNRYNNPRYKFTDLNNIEIEIVDYGDMYQKVRYYPNSAYKEVTQYYKDGSLKKNFYKFKDFIIGEFYEIDSLGNLHITYYDEPYKYNLDSLKNFVYNLGYDINSSQIEVFRQRYYGVYIYSINIRDTLRREIHLDAVTGEILRDIAYSSWDWGIRAEDEEMRLRDILRSVSTKRGDECYGWEVPTKID